MVNRGIELVHGAYGSQILVIENLNNVNCSARNPSKLPYLYDIKRQSNFRQGYPCRKHTENTSRKYEYSISIELGYPSERIPTDELILGECTPELFLRTSFW